MTKIFNAVETILKDGLNNWIESENPIYACDLHSELFNSHDHYIYYNSAREALKELGTLECIGAVQMYEKGNFEEIYTPFSNSCRVANMVIYILGYELLHEIFGVTPYYTTLWNEPLGKDDLKEMLAMAEKWFEENPEGLNKLWLDLPIE